MSDLDPVLAPEARRTPAELQRQRVARALKLSALFAQTERALREAVLDAASVDVVPAGEMIFDQGAPADTLVLIARGRARVERSTGDGGVFPLSYRGSGDVLGESCFGGAAARTERAVAIEEAEVVRVPMSLVRDVYASDMPFAEAALALLAARQREIEDRIESMLFRNVGGRLTEFLLKVAERWGVPTPRGVLLSAPLTHAEIAQVIGSTRETVTLTLGALRKEGLLDVAGRRLVIKDREALARRR